MSNQEYQVRLVADTNQASDKIGAVENSIERLTKKQHNIYVGVDANALNKSNQQTQELANNIRSTANTLKASSSIEFINPNSVKNIGQAAASVAAMSKDIKVIQGDLITALKKSTFSDILDTDKYLEKVKGTASAKTREIAEAYDMINDIPGVDKVLDPIEGFIKARAWTEFGKEIADQTIDGISRSFTEAKDKTTRFFYKDTFDSLIIGVDNTINTLARLGLAIQGVQLLITPLAQAWGAAFDAIIGQNIRLEQTILSTQTTLASTGRIFNNAGNEITDPLEKINALGEDVRSSIENIRVRSLDLAGVTSQEIIDIFGVVATSINQVGGNIKDAEDLAVSFTAALGTLGIPFYQARQEIGSILGGYITEDSLLAKRLQISNTDIQKAKQSIDGVTGYLKKKLEIAVAGQAISSKAFTGVTSNIKEIFEVVAQRIGQPLLKPLLGGLTTIYNFLKKIQGVLTEVGEFLSNTIAGTLTSIVNIFKSTGLAQSLASALNTLTKPYEDLQRMVELGLGGNRVNLIDQWINGLSKVPKAIKPIVDGLIQLKNFLQVQLAVITQPVRDLIDQTRDYATGSAGTLTRLTRITQIPFEGLGAFTKGWDTIQSTIKDVVTALNKLAATLIQIKITEFTSQLRAAAQVIKVFGNTLMGQINLAAAFFNTIAEIGGSSAGQLLVSFLAINKFIQSTEFFGIRKLLLVAASGKGVFRSLAADAKLFLKGFTDAGNVQKYVDDVSKATKQLTELKKATNDPILKNSALIGSLKDQIKDLTEAQTRLSALSSDTSAKGLFAKAQFESNTRQIETLTKQLRAAEQASKDFSIAQRVASSAKQVISASPQIKDIQNVAREATVVASGAASAQALNQILITLGERFGLTAAQVKTLSGAFTIARKSIMAFLTTTFLINTAFAVLSIGISAYLAYMQSVEDQEKRRQLEARRTADVNRILASSYTQLKKAAAGGDIAAQRRLEDDRDDANAAYQIQIEKRNKLLEEDSKLNEKLYVGRQKLAKLPKVSLSDLNVKGYDAVGPDLAQRLKVESEIYKLIQKRTKNRVQQLNIDKELYKITEAQNKLKDEDRIKEDFTVLGERRKDLEEKIKLAREDYNKEITDKEFQSRMQILDLEQQKRKQIQQTELKALQDRFGLLAQNATDQDAKIIGLVSDYEQALLNAANSEANLRADYVQKETQLRKEIEDYAFKMLREKANIEKQVGSYRRELETWMGKKQKQRQQEELDHLRSTQELQADTYRPYNLESQQQFTNAAIRSSLYTEKGFSASEIYALFQLFSKETLGVSGVESPEAAIAKLTAVLERLYKSRNKPFPTSIQKLVADSGNYTPDEGRRLVQALKAEGDKALNLNRYYTPKVDPGDLKLPNLSIDVGGQARLEAANQSYLESQRELDAAIRASNQQEIDQALKRFSNPALLGPLKSNYSTDLNTALTDLSNALLQLDSPLNASAISPDAEMRAVRTQSINILQTVLRTLTNLPEKDIREFANINGEEQTKRLRSAGASDSLIQKISDFIAQLNQGVGDYVKRIQTTSADRALIDRASQMTRFSKGLDQQRIEAYSSALGDSFTRLNEAVKASYSEMYSLRKAEKEARSRAISWVTNELATFRGKFKANEIELLLQKAKQYQDQLVRQAQILDPFNKAIERYTVRLQQAQQVTDMTTGGIRQLYLDVTVGGKTVKDALRSLADSLNKDLGGMVADWLIRPLRERLFTFFKGIFKVGTLEEQMQAAQVQAVKALNDAGVDLSTAADSLNTAGIDLAAAVKDLRSTSPRPNDTPPPEPAAPPSTPQKLVSTAPPTTEAETTQMMDTNLYNLAESLSKTSPLFAEINKNAFVVSEGLRATGNATNAAGQTISAASNIMVSWLTYLSQAGGSGTTDWISTLLGAATSFIPTIGASIGSLFNKKPLFRARGGSLSANSPAIVGERGPELFIPDKTGTIIPNNALGGNASNVVVNVDASGSKVQGDNERASALGRAVASAVQQELIRQKRPGGLLA